MRKHHRFAANAGWSFVLMVAGATTLSAQEEQRQQLPHQLLAPPEPTGEPVAPYFEGWYENPDGTYTFSFGYHNFNTEETVRIPLGTENFIEPSEFDLGEQPTLFTTEPDRRDVGVFTVTVPAEYEDGREVVWTLRSRGQTYWVPGRVGVDSYQLDYQPRAGGSVPPMLGFRGDGPWGQHPSGIWAAQALTTSVDEPLPLTVWATDPSERPDDPTRPDAGAEIPIGITWFTHQGPEAAEFEEMEGEIDPDSEDRSWSTTAVFREPGEYVLRVRADNWTARDSSDGNQCCWTNGYLRVTVAP